LGDIYSKEVQTSDIGITDASWAILKKYTVATQGGERTALFDSSHKIIQDEIDKFENKYGTLPAFHNVQNAFVNLSAYVYGVVAGKESFNPVHNSTFRAAYFLNEIYRDKELSNILKQKAADMDKQIERLKFEESHPIVFPTD
jgi:hypothetical protein